MREGPSDKQPLPGSAHSPKQNGIGVLLLPGPQRRTFMLVAIVWFAVSFSGRHHDLALALAQALALGLIYY